MGEERGARGEGPGVRAFKRTVPWVGQCYLALCKLAKWFQVLMGSFWTLIYNA